MEEKQQPFKRVHLSGHHDLLWELRQLCPCGSGERFGACCETY
ncbi:hypothetical protein GOV08_04940 [Candidatus Woesearchaeota archaeon]|nr:hypothetical protein [Candidatus Woesearchaeota archaeon]